MSKSFSCWIYHRGAQIFSNVNATIFSICETFMLNLDLYVRVILSSLLSRIVQWLLHFVLHCMKALRCGSLLYIPSSLRFLLIPSTNVWQNVFHFDVYPHPLILSRSRTQHYVLGISEHISRVKWALRAQHHVLQREFRWPSGNQ